jgi:SNF2 family DNA or RNA helicase
MEQIFAPGARVEIRDCEWIVRRADPVDEGGYLLTVDGLSELVQGKTAKFLTDIEQDSIRLLDPAETKLEQDTSPSFEKSRLFIETQLRQITPSDQNIHIGHKAAMDLVPYQLDPALQALKQSRQRILIADAVGLGKTLEAGILVSELMRRGKGKRILVLTLKSMMTQFQKEFWNRFTIPLTRLDSNGLQRVRNNVPGNHNPFYYYDKSIISIDTLKQDNEYRRHLEQAHWDIIVIDEVHNVAERSNGTSGSQRAKLAKLLSHRSDTMIMLSATPHDGKARSFASLMNMLDATAISDPEDYVKDDFSDKGLVIRRFKKDIQDQVKGQFKEREVQDFYTKATLEDEAAYKSLLEIPFTNSGEFQGNKGQLIRIGLQKALFSSPQAALVSTRERIRKLSNKTNTSDDEQIEIQALESFSLAVKNITDDRYSKYQQLISQLKSKKYAWNKKDTEDRLVIFSERIETIKWLEEQLSKDLKLSKVISSGTPEEKRASEKKAEVRVMHGSMSDIEQQEIVEQFGRADSKLRVLLCSDVASEGINLHYLSHRLVHFDLPWSLMVFQQRNGRVDRYGQNYDPIITYLITESENATVRGDTRILEILKEKDQQAYKNIGDPAVFMNVYDSQEEERLIQEAMAAGVSAAEFDNQYQAPDEDDDDDFMADFLSDDEEEPEQADDHLVNEYSLYQSDFHFCEAALTAINRENNIIDFEAKNETLSLVAPDDLDYRFKFLPPEIRPENNRFTLTQNKEKFDQEVKRSRQQENDWPQVHYLWAQHPVVEWLQAKIMAMVSRHSAPVLALPDGIKPGESIFLVSGLIPNKKAHPVIWQWFAVHCENGKVTNVTDAESWLKQIDLTQKRPNSDDAINIESLLAMRKPVIQQVEQKMAEQQKHFTETNQPLLKEQLERLSALQDKQLNQLEMTLETNQQGEQFKQAKRAKRTTEIEQAFNTHRTWVEDTMTIEPQPYCQIIAVMTNKGGL